MADGKVVYEIRGDNSGFQRDVNQTENIAKSKSSAIGGFASAAIAGIGTAVLSAGTTMLAFSKASVDAGSAFDKSMSQVAATMGVTTDEIQDLTEFAMEMGSTTAFSANEAAQALNYMALAGYDANTSMKMLPNVLNLAAAGGIDLARASDMVTDAQSALGLSLEDTNVLVDKMAKTASKSNTSVEQLGDAILTVGGTAKMLKGGTTELSTALGLLADNGIKGAEGGTALRNIILALGTPTDQAAAKLAELGVEVYDDEGKMRSLEDVFGDLNDAMKDMNDSEQADVLNTIFNKVDLKSANALLATSKDRWKDLSGAIDEASGAAQQMAETQLDNLAGDVTLFKSALEGAKITLSNSLTPALRSFVQFGTKEVTKLDNAFKKGGLNGLADQLGKSLGKAVKKLAAETPKFVQAAGKLALSLVDSLGSSLVKNFPSILRKFISLLRDLASEIASRIPSILGGIGEIIGDVIANVPNLLKLGFDIIKGLGKGIIEGIPKALEGFAQGISGLFSKPISKEVSDAMNDLDEFRQKLNEIGMDADEMYDRLSGVEADVTIAEYWAGVYDTLHTKTNLTKEEQLKLNQAVQYLNENVLPETAQLVQDESGYWHGNTDEIYKNIEAMKARRIAEIYLEQANDTLTKIAESQVKVDQLTEQLLGLEGKRDELSPRLDGISALIENAQADVDGLRGGVYGLGIDSSNVTQDMYDLAKAVGVTVDDFTDWDYVISEGLKLQGDLEDELEGVENQISATNDEINAIKDDMNTLNDTVSDNMRKWAEWSAEAEKAAEEAGENIGDGVIRGMDKKVGSIYNKAGELSKAAIDGLKSYALIASPSKRARKEVGEQIGAGEALGMEDSIPEVKKASEKLINAIDLSVPTGSVSVGSGSDDRVGAIISVLNKYLPRIGAPIVLDTGELVGATADAYDYELGVMQKRRARYE